MVLLFEFLLVKVVIKDEGVLFSVVGILEVMMIV